MWALGFASVIAFPVKSPSVCKRVDLLCFFKQELGILTGRMGMLVAFRVAKPQSLAFIDI